MKKKTLKRLLMVLNIQKYTVNNKKNKKQNQRKKCIVILQIG